MLAFGEAAGNRDRVLSAGCLPRSGEAEWRVGLHQFCDTAMFTNSSSGTVPVMVAVTVVVPGVVDFTEQADAAYARFAEAGMQVVQSTQPMADWPGWD